MKNKLFVLLSLLLLFSCEERTNNEQVTLWSVGTLVSDSNSFSEFQREDARAYLALQQRNLGILYTNTVRRPPNDSRQLADKYILVALSTYNKNVREFNSYYKDTIMELTAPDPVVK